MKASVAPYTLEMGQKITGIPAERIRAAAEMYARGPRTSTLWAMGLTQHATGTDIVASLLNLLLACGMIGKWGAADDADPRSEQRAGRQRRRRDPLRVHRLSPGDRSGQPGGVRQGVGSTGGFAVAQARDDGDGDDPGRQSHPRALRHGGEPGDLRSQHRPCGRVGAGARVPGGAGPLPHGNGPLGRRGLARLLVCGEVRHLRQHRAADPAGRGRRSIRRETPGATWTF